MNGCKYESASRVNRLRAELKLNYPRSIDMIQRKDVKPTDPFFACL
jgi:hypothetical protein